MTTLEQMVAQEQERLEHQRRIRTEEFILAYDAWALTRAGTPEENEAFDAMVKAREWLAYLDEPAATYSRPPEEGD